MSTEQRNAEKCAWEALKQQALSPKGNNIKEFFTVHDTCGDSLSDLTAALLISQRLTSEPDPYRLVRDPVVAAAIRDVFYTAQHLGLIVLGVLGQSMDYNAGQGTYQFTLRGIAFFKNGEVSLSAPGLLVERISEIVSEGSLDPGIVPLSEEAQRCWSMGCLRAAMVLIGLASEEVCIGLMDELSNYQSPPLKGEALHPDWEKLKSENLSFYPRWQSGLVLLEAVKQGLKKTYRDTRPDWWSIWESFPVVIQPYAEAVRIARNTAAHEIDDIFTPAQIGLLLASLPTMLGVVAELTAFLKLPPVGVTLFKI